MPFGARWVCYALLAAYALIACRATPAASDSARVSAEVRVALSASVSAWNSGDLEGHIAVYDDSATLLPRAAGVGRAQARANVAGFFLDPARRPTLRLDSLHVDALGADAVVAAGRWNLHEGSEIPAMSGWFTEVWRKTPRGWRIVHEQSQ